MRAFKSQHRILYDHAGVCTYPTSHLIPRCKRPRRSYAVSKTIPQQVVQHPLKDTLPPEVGALLNSPDLERPEGTSPYQFLQVTEAYWRAMKKHQGDPGPAVIHTINKPLPTATTDFDVIVCGATLGIFLALALQQKGYNVCVLEKRVLQGRNQEWNISRAELMHLVSSTTDNNNNTGLLTEDEMESCIATEWENDRISMKGGKEVWVEGVLNIGVSPKKMLDIMKEKFIAAGGTLLEHTAFKTADVMDNGVLVKVLSASLGSSKEDMEATLGDVNRPMAMANPPPSSSNSTSSSHSNNNSGNNHNSSTTSNDRNGHSSTSNNNNNGASPRKELTTRLLIDCMGHYSPIVKQIRNGQKADGMVIVVGGAMSGIPSENNTTADLIHTFTDAEDDMQLFWEAFPSDGGKLRTSYMFTYSDIHEERPSFTSLLQTYLKHLPDYQRVPLSEISFKRLLFGGFPCYMKDSPLPPAFNRVLQIGDASAAQSPLSFGGFACMVRNLPKLVDGVDEALISEKLDKSSLGWIQPYQPALSLAWLYQRAMSIRVGQLITTTTTSSGVNDSSDGDSEADSGGHAGLGNAVSSSGNGVYAESIPSSSYTSSNNSSKPHSSKTTALKTTKTRGWLPPDHINRLMRCNFAVMAFLGDNALKSFLLDTMKLLPLTLTMWGMMLRDPICITRVLFQVGPKMIIEWFGHFLALAVYTVLYRVLKPFKRVFKGYRWRRFVDALQWGSSGI